MKYAIVGSGAIGSALARRFVASEIEVAVANSKGPESLAALVHELGPLVKPVTTAEALRAEVVILAIPFDAVPDAVNGVEWSGRIVVDATNAVDLPAFRPRDLNGRLSTQIVTDAVPGARVVKAFNTLPAASLGAEPSVSGGRRVLFVSGDDAPARGVIFALIERLGFAAVDLGVIAEGGRAQQFGNGVAAKVFVLLGNGMPSNIEENKTLVRRFFAAIEAADFQVFEQIVAEDYNDHLAGQSPGRESLKQYFGGLHAAFADLKLPISAIVAEDDKVAVLNAVRGTHKGDFAGLEASGRSVNAMAFQLYRIQNGQLTEHWEVADFSTLLRQIQG